MSQNQGNAGVEEELHNTTGIMSVFFFNILCLQIFLKNWDMLYMSC